MRPFRLASRSMFSVNLLPGALAGLAVLAASLVPAALWPAAGEHAAAQPAELVIEIHPNGFNPPECTLNRNSRLPIRFINKDTKPRRIVVDELYAPEPGGFARDTGWIEPGEAGHQTWTFGEIQDLTYRDHDDPSLTGKIFVPLSNNAGTDCDIEDTAPVPGGMGCNRVFSEPLGCGIVPRVTTDGPLQ